LFLVEGKLDVQIKSTEGKISISCQNSQCGIVKYLEGTIEEDGFVHVSLFKMFDAMNAFQGGSLQLTAGKSSLLISNGETGKKIPIIKNTQEFNLQEGALLGEVKNLPGIMSSVSSCAASDAKFPGLKGVWVSVEDGFLKFVSTDGFRVSERTIKVDFVLERPLLIPIEFVRLTQNQTQIFDFDLEVFDQEIRFKSNEIVLFSVLLHGEYPDYMGSFMGEDGVATTRSELLVFLVDFLNKNPKQMPIRVGIGNGALSLTLKNRNKRITESIAIPNSKMNASGYYNSLFLYEAFDGCPEEEVLVGIQKNLGFCIKAKGYRQVVMPLKAKS
jgi:DNA polymerase III sliding clamp (beta) subunit (PCNA family)